MKITLYTPHENQKFIHKAINGTPCKYFTLSIGRQFGKSMLAQNQCVDFMCNKGWSGAWVSPTYKQAKKVADELDKAFKGLFTYNKSELTMKMPNGNMLQFFSSERYDNIRGFTFDFLVIDEAAHQQEKAWTEVLRATVLVKGKKVLFVSTPKGKNWFHTMFQMGMTDDNYTSFQFTSYDNPLIDPKEIDGARDTLPDHVFKQEYLAEFLDDGSGVFINVKDCVESVEPKKSDKYYAGIDLGRADDYTVLTIVNQDNKEVYCERWRRMEWSHIINELVKVLNKYKPNTLVEANGTQDAIYEMIRNKVTFGKGAVNPFITTKNTKPEIIENLIVKFEKKELSIIGYDWQVSELNSFSYEYNPKTRAVKYSAPVGLHDDYVMSRAICSHAVKKKRNYGVYNIV